MEVRGDFLVIGGGVAGLRASIALAQAGAVVLLNKSHHRESNTGYAQGGIAAALGRDDAPSLHAADTVAAGDGLCVPSAVEVLVNDGRRLVEELLEWGAAFERDAHEELAFGLEGAHSVRRVLHARDATGQEIGRVLWTRVRQLRNIRVLDGASAVALTLRDGHCVGASFLDRAGQPGRVDATSTLLATGGASFVFRETTNPPIATGDGIDLAAAVGARIMDMEFVQFHPTVLSVEGRGRFLMSEALRGEGAALVNSAGTRFMEQYDPAGALAPRDVVARAIVQEMTRTGAPVYLSLAHLNADYIRDRFPTLRRACTEAGLDLATEPIPVSPAAHYVMGGVETDRNGRTSVPGLFAAGEVACTGVHGANRLASNSLLEGLVFGARAGAAMTEKWQAPMLVDTEVEVHEPTAMEGVALPSSDEVRALMWQAVGLRREPRALRAAVGQLERWAAAVAETRASGEPYRVVRSLVNVGWFMAHAALRRTESRGAHFRADHTTRDDLHWQRHIADVRRPFPGC